MSTDTRIESLETQVRTLKRMLFGVFGVVVVGGLLAATNLQSVPDVVRAKMFEVVNDEGKVVASIGADAEGGVLSIGNNEGEEVAAIAATVDGDGGIVTIDSKGKITSETP